MQRGHLCKIVKGYQLKEFMIVRNWATCYYELMNITHQIEHAVANILIVL